MKCSICLINGIAPESLTKTQTRNAAWQGNLVVDGRKMVFCLFSSAAFLFDSSVVVIMILGSAHFQCGRFTPLAHV